MEGPDGLEEVGEVCGSRAGCAGGKREYLPPELIIWGSVEDLTAGSFGAPGDDAETGSAQ